jgi:hypothetical protein
MLSLLPQSWLTPRWASFVEEPKAQQEDLESTQKSSPRHLTLALLGVSVVGFGAQLWTLFHPHMEMIYLTISWAVACLLIVIYRPVTTPKGLLVLFVIIFSSQLIVFIDKASHAGRDDVPLTLAIIAAFTAIMVISAMPMRDPLLPNHHISMAFSPPTSGLRSPEDNLTLLQFMTVSWMSPLISRGNTRQLHDEDVWSLSYEFQHRILHDTFRDLHGSVLGRLLEANGLDLFIISILSIIELFASKLSDTILLTHADRVDFSAPVLLQKILQSMENPLAPRRAAMNYAVLSLVVRLIASQSAVFTLWYGRRAYERSRGEMITMLYEKTLSRKVVSISSKTIVEVNLDITINGASKHVESRTWKVALNYLISPFKYCFFRRSKSASKEKQLASMGKILNLMR